MKHWKIIPALLIVTLLLSSQAFAGLFSGYKGPHAKPQFQGPKYIFYFIGDGMGMPVTTATEHYLAAVQQDDSVSGGVKEVKLTMSSFPVQGVSTTYANNRYITGSAAAVTALACGKKTSIGTIGMDDNGTATYTNLGELAKAQGRKVGIISSVSIDHATPAGFYAHVPSRSLYHDIDMQLANSGFDYFGGGGLKAPEGNDGNALSVAEANGYTSVTTWDELNRVDPGQKVIAYDANLQDSKALHYEIDRVRDAENHISLAQFTRRAIELLDGDNGFFIVVEGGKIDWACHANDAKTAIMDTIAFDDAIAEAVAFMNRHPEDTLIVVTSDHECGGMTIGFANNGYDTDLQLLEEQTMSFTDFDTWFEDYKSTSSAANIDATLWGKIQEAFGMSQSDFTDYEIAKLESAYDNSMGDYTTDYAEEDMLLYGSYEPLTVTLTHVINNKAGLAWTSYSHTGVPVSVLATGACSENFDGFYDNTDIAKKIAQAMGESL
jgi:alkaline phosphatase